MFSKRTDVGNSVEIVRCAPCTSTMHSYWCICQTRQSFGRAFNGIPSVLLPNQERPLGPGYTRDWLAAYSLVSRARARRDTTRRDCFVVVPAHTGVTIVYCGTVVPSCSSQLSARWLSITGRNACSSDTEEENRKTVLGTSHLQLQIVKRKILHPVRKSTWTSH